MITGSPKSRLIHCESMALICIAVSRGLGLHAATASLLAGAKANLISGRKASGERGSDQAVDRLNKLADRKRLSGRAIKILANPVSDQDIKPLLIEVTKGQTRPNIIVAT